ncbi:hypothetical protein [Mitsuaria sp. GD03876]|uniref:hypothetical protein n=1 Tax=Mitsuaria sp. GD03876 TaxID=2975399 RepID=UPI00244D1BB8|nr:hypothetical protein [Mitsuaria sp. GD03876]MDH0867860.1 hypothetical protein [Mitsuaria sp. GD03876]
MAFEELMRGVRLAPYGVCRVVISATLLACATAAHAVEPPSQATSDPTETAREIVALKDEQTRLINQIKEQLALLRQRAPGPQGVELRLRFERMLAEIEGRIADENAGRSHVLSPQSSPEIRAYYARQRQRIEDAGSLEVPQVGGKPVYGDVLIQLELSSEGEILHLSIERSDSIHLSVRAIELLRQLAPFERFPPDVAKTTSRLSVMTRMSFRSNGKN